MNLVQMRKALAIASLTSMTACGGGGGGSGAVVPTHNGGGPSGHPLLARIVGVGDSLTAGYQAGGMLGATGVPDHLFPGFLVPPTQEQGWWADVDEEASGLPLSQAIANEYDPGAESAAADRRTRHQQRTRSRHWRAVQRRQAGQRLRGRRRLQCGGLSLQSAASAFA